MANSGAILVAAFIHIFLRITIFLQPNDTFPTPQTPISSWLFFIAILEILWDSDLMPERYKIIPIWCQWCVEMIAAIFIIEFGMIVIWFNLEKLMYRLLKSAAFACFPRLDYKYGDIAVEAVTVSISLLTLYYVTHGTDTFYKLRKRCGRFNKVSRHLKCKASDVFATISWMGLNKHPCPIFRHVNTDVEDGLREVFVKRTSSARSSRSQKKRRKAF